MEVLYVFIGAVFGVVATVVGSWFTHRLSLERDRVNWEREQPDREKERELHRTLAEEQRRHEHRSKRFDQILEMLDSMMVPAMLREHMTTMAKLGLSDAAMTPLNEALERMNPTMQADVNASRMLACTPMISDPIVAKKLTAAFMVYMSPSPYLATVLRHFGYERANEAYIAAYKAMEDYIAAEV